METILKVVLGILLTVGAASAVVIYSGQKISIPFSVETSGNYVPQYPMSLEDRIYKPIYGQIDCRTVDPVSYTTPVQATFTQQTSGWWVFSNNYAEGTYTCNALGGCEIHIFTESCGQCCVPLIGTPCAPKTTTMKQVAVGGQALSYPYRINQGQSYNLKIQCSDCYGGPRYPTAVDVQIVAPITRLYITAHGEIPGGYIAGTDNCALNSNDATTLKNMQATDSPLQGIETITPGTTKNVIVGWKEDVVFGNTVTYNGQKAVCQNYQGLYTLKKFATVGGKNYWQKDKDVKLYAQNSNFCCDNTGCASGFSCDTDFTCKAKPVVCQSGSCGAWGTVESCGVSQCVEKGNSQYAIRTYSCDSNNCCVQNDAPQACCPATCDRLSTASTKYQCNPLTGCVAINYQQECGNGYCCNVQGEGNGWSKQGLNVANTPYKTQDCINKKCCFSNPSDPYRGTCLDNCTGTTPQPQPQPTPIPLPGLDWNLIGIAALALLLLGFGALAYRNKNKKGIRHG